MRASLSIPGREAAGGKRLRLGRTCCCANQATETLVMEIASTTAEVAKAAGLSDESILRMRRDPHGPFQQHRDWQFIGLGTRKIRWNKE